MSTGLTGTRIESDSTTSSCAVIPEVLERHLSEFQALWTQRQQMLQSPDWNAQDLRTCEQRLEAHLDGLMCAGEAVLPCVERGLSEDEPAVAFTSAYVLLRLNSDAAANRVLEAFLGAKGAQLEGIRDALCQSSLSRLVDQLAEAVTSAPPPVAVAAACALACHGKLDAKGSRWRELLGDEDPAVRAAAWKVVAVTSGGSRDARDVKR